MSNGVAMNAEVTAKDDSRAVQIRKVQQLSNVAKLLLTLLTIVALVAVILTVVLLIASPMNSNSRISMATWEAIGAQSASLRVKITALVLLMPFVVLAFLTLRHLNLLFESLSQGIIYTKDNVRHILQVGRLWLIFGVFNLSLPVLTMIPLWIGFIDRKSVTMVDYKFPPGTFSAFAFASLVVLLAWIMDVGRQTQDEAAQLREEANLVV